MTQRQIDALSSLLLRVQENRAAPRRPRAAVAALAPSAAVASVARAAVASPALVAAPEFDIDDFSDRTPAPPPPPPPRRPGADRRATPLEMAVAGELEQQLAAASEARAIASPAVSNREAAAVPEPRREAPAVMREAPAPAASRAVRPAPAPLPFAEPIADAQALQALQPSETGQIIEPRIIEPDPPREVVRPIAQVMSKHSPAVDATFGAMLKRSLSLRPH